MTDKQIINGIDVSGCEHIDFDCANCEIFANMCHENSNCYYKQLKRKEQECEELKQRLRQCWTVENSFVEQLDQLKTENKKLKEILKTRIEDLCDSCGASSMMPMPCKVYEQALLEIKEIAERGFKYSQCNCGAKADLDLILQKISECEGNDVLL